MPKYLLLYRGGSGEMSDEAMNQWMTWFGGLGDTVVDPGTPLGPSATVVPGGDHTEGAASGLGGYSIITADDLHEATHKAAGCPVLNSGGSVEVYETVPIG